MITEIGEKIIAMRINGTPLKKIRKALGCSIATVSKWSACISNNESIIRENTQINNDMRWNQGRKQREIDFLKRKYGTSFSNKTWRRKQEESVRAFLLLIGGDACQVCNYNRCKANLCFHHIVTQDKRFQLNGRNLYRYSRNLIIEEAKKCALICVLHHGEIHNGFKYELKPLEFSGVEIPDSFIEWYEQHPELHSSYL